MDVCDKAAKLIECGNENSPEALAGLVDNMENAFAVLNFEHKTFPC
jgi:hypothetical protein